MSDIHKAFTFLHDGLPQWLNDVASIHDKVVAMQQDLAKMPVSPSPCPKHKTDSTASIRHDAQTDPVGTRKRKTLSAASGHASGPSRYRPRTMVVVRYDGDMQKSFELLVRAIGTARNMLRKAKMEARMNDLAALAGSSDDEDNDQGDAHAHARDDAIMAKISYRPRMATMRARTAGQPGTARPSAPPIALFDSTDKMLEQAQQQCEKAAHLTLRDGDCRTELRDVRNNFEKALDAVKLEVDRGVLSSVDDTPQLQPHDTSDTSVSSVEPAYKRHFPHINAPPSAAPAPAKSISVDPLQPKILHIEVDDQDDDEEDFVMPPVRLTSRLGARV